MKTTAQEAAMTILLLIILLVLGAQVLSTKPKDVLERVRHLEDKLETRPADVLERVIQLEQRLEELHRANGKRDPE